MARSTKQGTDVPQGPARLKIAREKARAQLQSRAEIGRGLLDRGISSENDLKEARNQYYTWSEYNEELLRRIFTTDQYAKEYAYWGVGILGGRSTIQSQINDHQKDIKTKLRRIESIAERLDLIEEEGGVQTVIDRPPLEMPQLPVGRKIFVVHGRDDQMKETVARFLERLKFEPVILAEQPNQGRTIIEKFEQEAGVGFAVVLLSPDDSGGLNDPNSAQQPRARQNVILELGYFIGKIGRSAVCALKKGDLELPSDIVGVVYTPFGSDEGWKLKLAQELRAAGMEVDFNLL